MPADSKKKPGPPLRGTEPLRRRSFSIADSQWLALELAARALGYPSASALACVFIEEGLKRRM